MEACPIADIFRPSATVSQVPGSSIDRYNNFITGTLAPSPPVVCVSVGPCSCQSPQSHARQGTEMGSVVLCVFKVASKTRELPPA